MKRILLYLIISIALLPITYGQGSINLRAENCSVFQGRMDTIGGRHAFSGTAILKDIEFTNGTIEWDLWAKGGRSYAGVIFHHQPDRNSEEFYVRPHKGNGLFGDAFQYAPVYHGVSCWQLLHGEGGTQPAFIPAGEWIHFKLSVKDDRAVLKMYTEVPVTMNINKLWLGNITGSIGVKGPADGSTYFSNFKWKDEIDIEFPAAPLKYKSEPGIIRDWAISKSFLHNDMDPYVHYSDFEGDRERIGEGENGRKGEGLLDWQKVETEEDGLVNLTKAITRNPSQPGWVYARATILSDKKSFRKFQLAYSDYVTVFVNGQAIMSSTNAYMSRDPAFAGLIGYFDEVFLTLEEGKNEICLLVGEQFGGWGFKLRDGEITGMAEGISEKWEIKHSLGYPESAVYDPENDMIYVSNFITETGGGISKISLEGEVQEYEWVKGLISPTGLSIYENKIYVVERGRVAIIDKKSGEIIDRIVLEGSVFPNDITVSDEGVLYISDSGGSKIYRIINNNVEIWMKGSELKNPNGIEYYENFIYTGCSGDASIKKIDIETGEVITIATLPTGSVLDGLQATKMGELFFSDFNGHLFHLDTEGNMIEIINTISRQVNLADFELIESKNLLVVPGLYSNIISAYSYSGL